MTSKDSTHLCLEKIVEATGGVRMLRGDEESTAIYLGSCDLGGGRLTYIITLAEIRPIRQISKTAVLRYRPKMTG